MNLKLKALKILIGLFSLVVIFHLLIITQAIPYTIVWAGKLKSLEEMYTFEAVSLAVNSFLIIILLIKDKNIKNHISNKVIDGILWLFIVLFLINTAGNLMAKTLFEILVFTPLTLLSAILIFIIVKKDKAFIANK